jgi:hypothetical protein
MSVTRLLASFLPVGPRPFVLILITDNIIN